MRKLKLMLMLVAMACLGMTGCSKKSPLMQLTPSKEVNDAVSQDEAAIVFFRPVKTPGGHVSAPIIEVDENGTLSFVTVIAAQAKYIHRTAPGKHRYFIGSAGGEKNEILEANLEAGKTYYVYINPNIHSELVFRIGYFSFDPVTDVTDDAFKYELARRCRWVRNTPMGEKWFLKNKPSVQAKYNRASEGDVKIILPEYGTAVPVRGKGSRNKAYSEEIL